MHICFSQNTPLKLLKQRRTSPPSPLPLPIHHKAQLHGYRNRGVHDQQHHHYQSQNLQHDDDDDDGLDIFQKIVRPAQRRKFGTDNHHDLEKFRAEERHDRGDFERNA